MPVPDIQVKETHMVEARRRWTECRTFYEPIFRESREDWRFYANRQWDEALKTEREDAGKPCITNNRISTFVRNVDNQIGAMKIAGKVSAVSDATETDAEHQQGLIRAIQTESHAEIAYGCARKSMIIGGHGYSRVCADYADWKSFDQNLKVERILDPHTVMFDPSAIRPDRIDARYCFVGCKFTPEAAKDKFGEDVDLQAFADTDGGSDWLEDGEFVWFVDYYYEELVPRTLVQYVDDYGELQVALFEDVPQGVQVVKKRDTFQRVIHWEVLNGLKVIKEYEVRGSFIPIAPLYGDEIIIDGQLEFVGLVRYLRDPQRMLNYWESAIAQIIGIAPITPFIGYGSVIGKYAKDWEEMNIKPRPVLRIEAIPDGRGGYLPPPTREVNEPPIQAMVAGRTMTEQNLQAVSGLFDPSLGKGQADQSGNAIQALQSQGNLATWNYTDTFNRHVMHVCAIILDQAPFYYDAGRVMQIDGLDGQKKSVYVHNSDVNKYPQVPDGINHVLDLGKGKYAISIDAGPSSETQRKDNVTFWMQMIQKFPQIMQVAGDLIVGEMDSPQAKAIAERLKIVLPPQVQALLAGNTPNPQAQQAQAQLQAAQVTIQKLMNIIQTKKLELDSKERIAAGGDATSIIVAEVNAKQANNEALLQSEVDQLNAVLGHVGDQQQMAHEAATQAADHQQQQQQTQLQGSQAADQSAQEHAQSLEQQQAMPTTKLPA